MTLPTDAMAQLFAAAPANDIPDVPNYNICPTDALHVIHSDGAQRRLSSMRWGFIPQWYKQPNDGPLLINARAETIADKPAFRIACRERRCLVLATGFFEWTKDADGNRLPWFITRQDGAPLALAAIWQEWGGDALRTCAVVTTQANPAMSTIHHRMPVVLEPEQLSLWLGEEGKGAARLMQPAPDETLQMHRVGTAVNSNRAAGPELIEPFD